MIEAARQQLAANPTAQLAITFAIIDTDVAKVFRDRLNPSSASARQAMSDSECRSVPLATLTFLDDLTSSNDDQRHHKLGQSRHGRSTLPSIRTASERFSPGSMTSANEVFCSVARIFPNKSISDIYRCDF